MLEMPAQVFAVHTPEEWCPQTRPILIIFHPELGSFRGQRNTKSWLISVVVGRKSTQLFTNIIKQLNHYCNEQILLRNAQLRTVYDYFNIVGHN